MNLQCVGPHFDSARLANADRRAAKCLAEIGLAIVPRMLQESGTKVARRILRDKGVERHWHQPIVHFGAETTKTFRDKSDAQTRLSEGDLFYVDIGPVFEGHAADRGNTFQAGSAVPLHPLIRAAHNCWNVAAEAWRRDGLNGVELYSLQ